MNRKGCDSGFFLLLGKGEPRVRQIWQEAVNGHCSLVMSTLSIHEVLVVHYRHGKSAVAAQQGLIKVTMLT